jgi:hypothetical protein
MAIQRTPGLRLILAGAALAAACGSVHADEVPLVTGRQWVESTDQAKKAYLVGIANVVQVERAYEANTGPTDGQSLLPRMAKGLRGETLDSVRDKLDRWYASNPGQLQRPVIETIWFEMVLPGLQASK